MSFEEYYWHQFDVLNKDTQLARQFGQDVWDYKQAEIDELKNQINRLKQEKLDRVNKLDKIFYGEVK